MGLRRRRSPLPRVAGAATALIAAAVVAGLGAAPAGADFALTGNLGTVKPGRIWDLAIDPASPTTALAATDAGVLLSVDRGATWRTTSIHGIRAWTVGFDARADAHGAHTAYAGLDRGGFLRSADRVTWTDASAGLPNRNVRSLALGLAGLAVGTDDGVAVSADGQTWRSAGLRGYGVSAVAVSANTPTFTLVAGVDAAPAKNNGFLFRDAGPGPDWEPLTSGLPATGVVSAIAAGPLPQSTMTRPLVVTTDKGVFRSGDGGNTWTASAGPPADNGGTSTLTLTTVAFSPSDPNLVYGGMDAAASSGGALYRSTDGGATFAPADRGLADDKRNVATLAVAPTSPPLVFAGVDPPGGGAVLIGEIDTSAPAPAAVAAENGAPPQTPGPAPTAAATPPPAPGPAVTSPGHGGLRGLYDRLVGWPFPLSLELLVILAAVYFAYRRRQRRLDIEGPP